jgi:hypothetical protein
MTSGHSALESALSVRARWWRWGQPPAIRRLNRRPDHCGADDDAGMTGVEGKNNPRAACRPRHI